VGCEERELQNEGKKESNVGNIGNGAWPERLNIFIFK
jgi:hypothetical protein